MSYKNRIETIEHEIKELSETLYKALVPLEEPYPSFFSFLNMEFTRGDYPEAIASLEWALGQRRLTLPDTAKPTWDDIKIKAGQAHEFYKLERQGDESYKDPVTHMNALTAADEDIPNDFGKRYGLSAGDVKCLWLISPGFEERFIRQRIAEAVARNGSRDGHYIFTKRRYKLTEKQAKRLVDDIWGNLTSVSKVFHELLDQEKLLRCRLAEEHQDRVLQIRADYSISS